MPPKDRKDRKSPKDKPKSGNTFDNERIAEIFFLLLLFVALFGVVAGFLQGGKLRSLYARFAAPTALSYYDQATGARVYASANEASVRESPGGQRIGSQAKGAAGTIKDGPVSHSTGRYWYVDFDSGPDGWVNEEELRLFESRTKASKFISFVVSTYKTLALVASLMFIAGSIYSFIRTSQISAEVSKREKEAQQAVESAGGYAAQVKNDRWEMVLAHAQSNNPSDWRLAILEADIILEELMRKMGYHGDTLGDMLKAVEPSDFLTLDDAWEAHKVRNIIAHKGSDYVLSRRESQRVISLFARVFREFRYISHESDMPQFSEEPEEMV